MKMRIRQSKKQYIGSERKKRKVTDTDSANLNSPQKLLINRTIPIIIHPIDPRILYGVATGRGTNHLRQTPTSKVIVLDAARSSARVFRDPVGVRSTGRDGTTPRDCSTSIFFPKMNYSVIIGVGTTV